MIALEVQQQLQRATDTGSWLVWSIFAGLAVVWLGGGLVSAYGARQRARGGRR